MKRLAILFSVLLAFSLAACGGGDDDDGGTPPPSGGFTQPAGTVAVNFTVDDSLNKVFAAGEMEWKGSFLLNEPATRIVTYDSTWGGGVGPYATLYDDGPWNVGTPPGHEPKGSVAGDNKWGVTVFVTPPATGSQTYEYGLNDVYYQTEFGNGWMWPGSNGSFVVNAGATAEINAPGLTLTAFGTNDMQLVLDTTALGAGTWDTTTVTVKGSAWGWSEIPLTNDGTGKYALVLSDYVGAGNLYKHTGLLKPAQTPEFIYVLNGVEYKDGSGVALADGVTAATRPPAGAWTPATIEVAGNNNTFITVP